MDKSGIYESFPPTETKLSTSEQTICGVKEKSPTDGMKGTMQGFFQKKNSTTRKIGEKCGKFTSIVKDTETILTHPD